MEIITSATNGKVKELLKLKQRKYREQTGLFIVEGKRNVELILSLSQAVVRYLIVSASYYHDSGNYGVTEQSLLVVSDELFAKFADTTTPQGIMAVLEQPHRDLATELLEKHDGLFLVLDRLQDPGNVGTLIRSADAMHLSGIICLKGTVDIFSPKVVRAAMGSILSVPVWQNVLMEELISIFHRTGGKIVATELNPQAKSLYQFDFKNVIAVILGNEANGVEQELVNASDEQLYIPMRGNAESLNVAIAGALIMYEYNRHVDIDKI